MAANQTNTYIQNIFYHYILSEPSLATKFEPEFFLAKPVQISFKLAKEFVIKYHSEPSADQMKQLTRQNGLEEQLPDDIIDALYSQKQMLASYPEEWLYDETTDWAMLENVKKAIYEAAAYLKLNQDNMESGKAREIVEHIKTMFNRTCVLEFADTVDHGSDFWDAESHKQKKMVRRPSGFPFIDYCLNGGWFDGCLACFVGAPKIGKSLWLQNLCAESVKAGENSAYITLELPEEMVNSRMGSNMFSIPSLEYDKYSADTAKFKEIMNNYRKSCLLKPGELLVKFFPTSTLTVIELESFLLSEEERRSTPENQFKFKNVFVDYINIMRNYRNPNSENTYMKIKQIAEDLKAMGAKNGWAIITATQTNRAQFDTNDVSASNVAESTALGATVDVMFGLIADPMMKAKGEYYCKCIYDRVSPQENKKKKYNCNFNFLRLTEDPNEKIIEVDFTFPQTTLPGGRKRGNGKPGSDQQFEPGKPSAAIQPNTEFDVPQPQTASVDLFANNGGTGNVSEFSGQPNNTATPLIKITGMGMF